MPETRILVSITKVIDDHTGMYRLGEIDGLFQKPYLDDYLLSFGESGKIELINHLAYLQSQVINAWEAISIVTEHEQCAAKEAQARSGSAYLDEVKTCDDWSGYDCD